MKKPLIYAKMNAISQSYYFLVTNANVLIIKSLMWITTLAIVEIPL